LPSVSDPVFEKQRKWQNDYQTDLNNIASYLADDYRGEKYSNFDPEHDPVLATVRDHKSYPVATDAAHPIDPTAITSPPNEADYAQLQAIVDEMGDLAPRLIASCVTAGKTCDAIQLKNVRNVMESAKAVLAVAGDNLKSLQTAQAAVVTNYAALDKVWLDFQNRIKLNNIRIADKLIVQDIPLGPDYGATDTGSIACSSDTTPAVSTTDAINFSVLFQNVPLFTVSAGLLTTFQAKNVIGTTQKLNSDGTFSTYFAVTDHAAAQVFPMAFANFRYWTPVLKTWWGQPENELVITNSVSGGIGVNSNTGTNQPEFFLGDAIGFSRVYIHVGAHFGRTESLGGGFQLNTVVPTGFTGAAPISWSYHPAFSIGFSVRIAPF
jgi:hypothetical protein